MNPTTNPAEPKTFSIPECKLVDLKGKLDKMVRKAAKLGIEGCSYTVGASSDVPYLTYFSEMTGRYQTKRYEQNTEDFTAEQLAVALKNLEVAGEITYKRFVEVTIAGPAPVLAGWEFVATLEHLTDDKGQPMNMLRTSPLFKGELPERFRTVEATNCDHCHQLRNRKDTYLVRNTETGEWKQIGSTCIADFLGGNDPRQVAGILAFWLDIQMECRDDEGEESGEYGPRGEMRWALRNFLALTAAVIREDGWMSKAKAESEGRNATVSTVIGFLVKPENISYPKKAV